MAYGLEDLQNILRYSARNAKTAAEYPCQQIDIALQAAIRLFLRLTYASREADTLTLVPGSNVLTVWPPGFLPEFLLSAYITLSGKLLYPELQIVTIEQLLTAQRAGFNRFPSAIVPGLPATGQPTMLAWTDQSTAEIYPIPDQPYAINLWWWRNLNAWRAGQAIVTANLSGGTIASFNIPVGGSIYASPPTVTITDPTGVSFAAGTATVGADGSLATIPISNAGTGYTAPTIYLNGYTAAEPVTGLADDALEIIAGLAAPWALQRSDPANAAFARECLAEFKIQAKQFAGRGAGGRGAQTLTRDPPQGNYVGPRQGWWWPGSGR